MGDQKRTDQKLTHFQKFSNFQKLSFSIILKKYMVREQPPIRGSIRGKFKHLDFIGIMFESDHS